MIKDIIEAFGRLIEVVKLSPTVSILTLLLVIALFAALKGFQNGIMLDELTLNPERNRTHFENSIKASEQINLALEYYRMELDADRVMVRQFHNGKQDLTGIPFTYVQTTYLAMKPLVSLSPNGLESKPLSGMVGFLRHMWGINLREPKCLVMNESEVADPIYRLYLKENGIQIVIACPLQNLLNYPIGYVVTNYLAAELPSSITKEIAVKKNEELALRIGGYLKTLENPPREKFLGLF